MLRTRNHSAIASTKNAMKPQDAGAAVGGGGVAHGHASGSVRVSWATVSRPRSRGRRLRWVGGEAGEEVVLAVGDRDVGQGGLELLDAQTRGWISSGTWNQKPSGSTCVAWASARITRLEEAAHAILVVTARTGRFQLASHSAYGLSSPGAGIASWIASRRARLKPPL